MTAFEKVSTHSRTGQIASARRIEHKRVLETQGWSPEVVLAPEVKSRAVYDEELNALRVRGEAAHPFFWYPRGAK